MKRFLKDENIILLIWSLCLFLFVYWAIGDKDIIMWFFAIGLFVSMAFYFCALKFPNSRFVQTIGGMPLFLGKERTLKKKKASNRLLARILSIAGTLLVVFAFDGLSVRQALFIIAGLQLIAFSVETRDEKNDRE